MTAGAGSGDADAVGVDLPLGSVVANESHGSMHVAHNVSDFVPWLRPVDDSEDRVTMVRIRFRVVVFYANVRRLPPLSLIHI